MSERITRDEAKEAVLGLIDNLKTNSKFTFDKDSIVGNWIKTAEGYFTQSEPTLEQFKEGIISQWNQIHNYVYTRTPADMAELVECIMENLPREEISEPKPRWKEKTGRNTYMVKEVGSWWEIWFYSEKLSQSIHAGSLTIGRPFPSEQAANEALDEWCMQYSNWERCDEKTKEPDPEEETTLWEHIDNYIDEWAPKEWKELKQYLLKNDNKNLKNN